MKPSVYIRMARTMLQIIRRARVPPYLHRKSNHVYKVWQHLVLLALRQYERKSYRRFADFLEESYGILECLGLSRIPHYTTLQKAAARLHNAILQKMPESFVLYCQIRTLHVAVDATGFGYGQTSYYYTKRYKLRRKFLKLSVCADTRKQIVCSARIRHMWRNDTVDFVPLLQHTCSIVPVGTVAADRGFDSEQNHLAAQEIGVARCIIRPRYENLQVWKTKGVHRKMMKRRFDWRAYHQRSKIETIFSVVKRMFGDCIMSRCIVTQNREMMYRIIAYNCYRITRNHVLILYGFYTAEFYKNSKYAKYA
jgi:hypothetical protein